MNSYNGFSPDQRNRADAWLKEQWRAGLPRPSRCVICGQTQGIIDAHAEDYSEPFGPHIYEYDLCYACHLMLHCRFRSPQAWAEYLNVILRSGLRHPALRTRNFDAIKAILNGQARYTEVAGPIDYDRREALLKRLR